VTDTGVYLYAITPETVRGDGLTGIGQAPVYAITHRGLAAHASAVPLDRFGEEPLRRNLEDLDWVEEVARAHHRVVSALAAEGATAPVRLVVVYTGDEQIRDLLDRRHDAFAEVLELVDGRQEWGVKAYATPVPSGGGSGEGRVPAGRGGSGGAKGGGAGLAYLQRRKAALRSRDDLWRRGAAQAERLHAALSAIAVAGRRHRPQDPRLSGRSDCMVLNGAYLLDPDRLPRFTAVLDAFQGQGLDIELTGPWAPYSFTTLELDPPGGAEPAGDTGEGADRR